MPKKRSKAGIRQGDRRRGEVEILITQVSSVPPPNSPPTQAIPFYEKALGMTTDEDDKKTIPTAREEARAVVQAKATPVPGPVPAPK